MKCHGFKGSECDREVVGELFNTKEQRTLHRFCYYHRPAVKDGRYTTIVTVRYDNWPT